jgi:hypothetical protein
LACEIFGFFDTCVFALFNFCPKGVSSSELDAGLGGLFRFACPYR